MTALMAARSGVIGFTASQLELIWRTAARDCNQDEYNQFIEVARACGLNPLKREIYAQVFSKDRPDKRNMVIVIGIGGYRKMAAEHRDYRPDENPARIEYDNALKGPTNPLGIVSATVTCFKHAHGEWHPITEIAYWDEFVPVEKAWVENEQTGKKSRSGAESIAKDAWKKMGRLMLAKCAEALALRKGWPDRYNGTYSEEELDRAIVIDAVATEILDERDKANRLAAIGKDGPTTAVVWDRDVVFVPLGKFHDEVDAFIMQHQGEPEKVVAWADRNRNPLREFWAHNKNDAHDLKKKIAACEEAAKARAEKKARAEAKTSEADGGEATARAEIVEV